MCLTITIILKECGSLVVRIISEMVERPEDILDGKHMLNAQTRGTLGWGSGFGFARNGDGKFGDSDRISGIYQKRVTGYNQYGRNPSRPRRSYYVRMKKYRPTNPRTAPQQANRSKFTAANAAWNELTPEQKVPYNKTGKRSGLQGRSVFVREYMKNPEL